MQILFPFPRPLWVEYPDDLETFAVEDEYMLGKYLQVSYTCDIFCNYVVIIFSSENLLGPRKTTNKNKKDSITKFFLRQGHMLPNWPLTCYVAKDDFELLIFLSLP